jgi:class 3 adenylate cyclase
LVPIFASALLDRRTALFWLGAFIMETMFLVTFDAESVRLAPPVPPAFSFMNSILNISIVSVIIVSVNLYLIAQLDDARERADNLLLNILPQPIAEQLKRAPGVIADGHPEVTVLFADIAGFTQLSAHAESKEVVNMLNAIFSDFDDLAAKHGLEKIKTIGDAYMVVGGLPTPRADHAEAVVEMARDMLKVLQRHRAWNGEPIRVRVGINTGPVVAGVIGRQKFIYDLWGDAVNTASRMESNGLVDAIQVTESTYQKLRERYQFEQREPMHIKGKGQMVTYLLKGRVNGAG